MAIPGTTVASRVREGFPVLEAFRLQRRGSRGGLNTCELTLFVSSICQTRRGVFAQPCRSHSKLKNIFSRVQWVFFICFIGLSRKKSANYKVDPPSVSFEMGQNHVKITHQN